MLPAAAAAAAPPGAPLVRVGPIVPAVDKAGKAGKLACEIRHKRLRSDKKDEAYGIGRAHSSCRLHKTRDPSWNPLAPDTPGPPAAVPVRNHRKRASSPPSLPGQGSPTITLPPAHLHDTSFMNGWQLHPPSVVTAALSYRWYCLYLRARNTAQAWFSLRGNAWQLDASQPLSSLDAEQHRLSLLAPTIAALRRLLHGHGIQTSGLRVAALKLLRSEPGQGKQPVHYDVPSYEDAVQCYAVLLYCTETMSTAVPQLDAATMRPAFIDGENPTPGQKAEAERLCREPNFLSVPVQPGSTLVFSATTPHYGVRNLATVDRLALYALFSPFNKPGQDGTQRFPLGVTNN